MAKRKQENSEDLVNDTVVDESNTKRVSRSKILKKALDMLVKNNIRTAAGSLQTICPVCDEDIEIVASQLVRSVLHLKETNNILMAGCPNCCRALQLPIEMPADGIANVEEWAQQQVDDGDWISCVRMLEPELEQEPNGEIDYQGEKVYTPGDTTIHLRRYPYMYSYGVDPKCMWAKMQGGKTKEPFKVGWRVKPCFIIMIIMLSIGMSIAVAGFGDGMNWELNREEMIELPISDEKFPWESYTEMVAFVAMIASLAASFNLLPIVLTADQTAGIASIIFLIVMIVRKVSNGGKVVFSKKDETNGWGSFEPPPFLRSLVMRIEKWLNAKTTGQKNL
jgi:hypothetical protein